jgi:hypothetical protein
MAFMFEGIFEAIGGACFILPSPSCCGGSSLWRTHLWGRLTNLRPISKSARLYGANGLFIHGFRRVNAFRSACEIAPENPPRRIDRCSEFHRHAVTSFS